MKKYLYLLMLVAFVGFASCSKDESTGGDTTNKKESVLNGRWTRSESWGFSTGSPGSQTYVSGSHSYSFIFDNGSAKYIDISTNSDSKSQGWMTEGTYTITNEEAHLMKIVWKKHSTLDDNGNWIVTEDFKETEDTYNYMVTSVTLTMRNGMFPGEFTKEQ